MTILMRAGSSAQCYSRQERPATCKDNASASSIQMMYSRGNRVNAEILALLEAEFDETFADVNGSLLDLNVVEPLDLRAGSTSTSSQ